VVVLDNGRVAAEGNINAVSLSSTLRTIVGADGVGAVLDGTVLAVDGNSLVEVAVGNGVLRVHADASVGSRVRIQMLARDIIIATRPPVGLSVRNSLPGVIARIERDDDHADLIYVGIGNATVMARITRIATEALQLSAGSNVWVLIKAVSMRGHALSS